MGMKIHVIDSHVISETPSPKSAMIVWNEDTGRFRQHDPWLMNPSWAQARLHERILSKDLGDCIYFSLRKDRSV